MANSVEILGESAVTTRTTGTSTSIAIGSRLAVLDENEVVCSFMLQTQMGSNDFKPTIARSFDGGRTWEQEERIWADRTDDWSLFVSVSPGPAGELLLFGAECPIDQPGEPCWSDETKGLKQNQLIWARSGDRGRTWCDPRRIPMPIAGAVEAAGPICVTREGTMLACYSPYNNFDPTVKVDRNHLAVLRSADGGESWVYQATMRSPNENAGYAEAWLVQLADGRLATTCWVYDHETGQSIPNQYALSKDDGRTWAGSLSTGIMGQSVGLAPLPDGRLAMVYNQREAASPGVYLAIASPSEDGFGIELNEPIWLAAETNQSDGETAFEDWTDYAFGEPALTVMPDGTLLAVLWCAQPEFRGIRCVRVRIP